MNTLSRAITAQIFTSINTYAALQRHWSALMNSNRKHDLSAAHHLLYLALRGKDWRKGFTPVTNQRKLENGAFLGWALFHAIRSLHSKADEAWLLAPFEGLVTAEMLQFVRSVVPLQNPYAYRPQAFAEGMFPFEAYHVPNALLAITTTEDRIHA